DPALVDAKLRLEAGQNCDDVVDVLVAVVGPAAGQGLRRDEDSAVGRLALDSVIRTALGRVPIDEPIVVVLPPVKRDDQAVGVVRIVARWKREDVLALGPGYVDGRASGGGDGRRGTARARLGRRRTAAA